MPQANTNSQFKAKLRRPAKPGDDTSWAFVLLPKDVSETLPRRGRTTVMGSLNGQAFQATLEPDGQLSHWLRISGELREAAGAQFGDLLTLMIMPLEAEPEPQMPTDFEQALAAEADALKVWRQTTTLARVDWIHWISSARQTRTRAKRIADACEMLAAGKSRVCCFDPSDFYSKALRAPKAADF